MPNPFVYGEIVPLDAFADRDAELERLVADLGGWTEGLSDLAAPLRQVVAGSAGPVGARPAAVATLEITVSSFSSYVAFLEGYARALVALETRLERARAWLPELFSSMRPELRLRRRRAGGAHAGRPRVPGRPHGARRQPARRRGLRAARPHRGAPEQAPRRRPRRVPGDRRFRRRQRSSTPCARPCSSSARSATCSPARSRA